MGSLIFSTQIPHGGQRVAPLIVPVVKRAPPGHQPFLPPAPTWVAPLQGLVATSPSTPGPSRALLQRKDSLDGHTMLGRGHAGAWAVPPIFGTG